MFEDPKRLRQARTMLKISRRELAEAAGEKESSVVDIEREQKSCSPEAALGLWAGMWNIVRAKGQRFTKEQMEQHPDLLDMIFFAAAGLAISVSPEKLLAHSKGEEEIAPEERDRLDTYMNNLSTPPKRLTRESAARIRAKVNAVIKDERGPIQAKPSLSFYESTQMPPDEVINIVSEEIASFPWFGFARAFGKNVTPEDEKSAFESQLAADPRFKFATARIWMAQMEKERDDLKGELAGVKRELQETRDKLLKSYDELVETYRRISALEKEAQ